MKGKWILGGVERGSGECFLVECENNHRDHHTLTRLIKQHVRPGTVIITDGWRGYVHLSQHGYYHEDVNHSQNFVNPVGRMLAVCWPYVGRMLAVCWPYVSRMLAACWPYVGRMLAIPNRPISRKKITPEFKSYVSLRH